MKTPVSDTVRLQIFEKYQKGPKTLGILSFELGAAPGVIIFHTKAGNVPCTITEDKSYFYFQMPSGMEDRKVLKKSFLKGVFSK